MRRKIVSLMLFLCIVSIAFSLYPLDTGTNEKKVSVEQSLFFNDYVKLGNSYQLCKEWVNYIKDNVNSPLANLLLRMLKEDLFTLPYKWQKEIIDELVKISNDNRLRSKQGNGFNEAIIYEILDKFYINTTDYNNTLRNEVKLSYITDWLLIGPYGFGNNSELDEIYEPEVNLGRVLQEYRKQIASGKDQVELLKERTEFTKLPFMRKSEPINFYEFTSRNNGTIYALMQFNLREDMSLVFFIETTYGFKFWLDYKLVDKVDRFNVPYRNEFLYTVKLKKGNHLVLLKVVNSGGSLNFKILNSSGFNPGEKLVVYENDGKLHPLTANSIGEIAKDTQLGICYNFFQNQLNSNPTKLLTYLLLALSYNTIGEYDKSYETMKKVMSLIKKDDEAYYYWLYYYASLLADNELLPDDYKTTRIISILKEITDNEKNFYVAFLKLAAILSERGKNKEAIEIIDKVIAANPNVYKAYILGSEIAAKENWEYKSYNYLGTMFEIYPQFNNFEIHLMKMATEKGNYNGALALLEDHFETDLELKLLYANLLELVGAYPEAAKYYQSLYSLLPTKVTYLMNLADVFNKIKNKELAIKFVQDSIKVFPKKAYYYEKLANLYQQYDEPEKAYMYYEKALALDPSLHYTRKFFDEELLKKVRPSAITDKDIFDEFATTDEELSFLIRKANVNLDVFKLNTKLANIVYILDESIVRAYNDGSSKELVHQTYKIVSEHGLEEYKAIKLENMAEIVYVKVITPDGKTYFPTIVPGQNEIVLPHLQNGCIVDYKYIVYNNPLRDKQFIIGPFFFQDFRFDSAFLKSRFVVIAPKDMEIKYEEKNFSNFRNNIYFYTTTRGELKIYRWEANDMPYIERENQAVDYKYFMPHVYIGTPLSWNETAKIVADELYKNVGYTLEMAEEIKKLAEGKNDKELIKFFYDYTVELVKGEAEGSSIDAYYTATGNRLYLLKAILDILGIESYLTLVVPDLPYNVTPSSLFPAYWLLLGQAKLILTIPSHQDRIDVGQDASKELFIYLDNTNRFRVFGSLPKSLYGGTAFLIGQNGLYKVQRIPNFLNLPRSDLSMKIEVNENREAFGKLTYKFYGEEATGFRNVLYELNEEQRKVQIESFLTNLLSNTISENLTMKDVVEKDKPLEVNWEFKLPNFLSEFSNPAIEITNSAFSFKLPITRLKLKEKNVRNLDRRLPFVFNEFIHFIDRISIKFPQNVVLVPLAKGSTDGSAYKATYYFKNNFYTLTIKGKEGTIEIEREYDFKPFLVEPEEFKSFVDFCEKIDFLENKEVIIQYISTRK